MKEQCAFVHCEHVSERTFDQVVSAFEAAVSTTDAAAFRKLTSASADAQDFEARVRAIEGSSGFVRFLDIDHGAWMARIGMSARAKLYVLGNPLIARTMLQHDLGVGLNVPVRLMIYEDPGTSKARLAYDLPSSLMDRLRNEKVNAAARRLDEKLIALAESVTGAQA